MASDDAPLVMANGKKKSERLQNRRTPRWLFDDLEGIFGRFDLDAFAEPHNAMVPRYLTERHDGTRHPWLGHTFYNPPFAIIGEAVQQAVNQWLNYGVRSIGLGPVGCSQVWYHELAIRGTIYIPWHDDSIIRRVNYDLPDGTPTDEADRDTIIIGMGGEHENPDWKLGTFRVRRLFLRGPQ